MTKGTHSEEIDPLGKPTHGNEQPYRHRNP